jgi:hypothetical protein
MSAAVILTELWRSKRLSRSNCSIAALRSKHWDYSFKVQKFKAFWLVRRKILFEERKVEEYKRPSQ